MKLYIIETRESTKTTNGWKQIAVSNVLANSSYKALNIVNEQYESDEYIHKVVSSIELHNKVFIRTYYPK
ncbi:hypothetical protein EGCR1_18970 (plasmid) [Enterococcus gilvus]|jgi:hypothetical protein|nr:hypothetical protein EGCR1_18970 [Enterococcus gilvus]MDN6011575.1 hypothetical protein [Lactococcus lactis]